MPPPLDLETTAGLPFDVSLSLLLLLFSFPPGLGGLWSQSVFPRLVAPTQLCCSRPGQLCSFESLLPQLLDALEASQMFSEFRNWWQSGPPLLLLLDDPQGGAWRRHLRGYQPWYHSHGHPVGYSHCNHFIHGIRRNGQVLHRACTELAQSLQVPLNLIVLSSLSFFSPITGFWTN